LPFNFSSSAFFIDPPHRDYRFFASWLNDPIRDSHGLRQNRAMPAAAPGRSVPLRRRLLLLAVAGMLPIALMSGVALVAIFHQQRAQAERAGLEIARAFSIAIDAELQRSFSALKVFSNATAFDTADIERFRRALARTTPTQPNWRAVIVSRPDGTPVLHTGLGDVAPLVELESFERVLRERKPVVGHAARGPRGGWAVPLRMPVVREGAVRFVITAAVSTESLLDLIRRQRLPEGWYVTVIDGRGIRLARWPGNEQYLGTPASPSLAQWLRSTPENEGVGFTSTSEGTTVYTAFVRIPQADWTVALGVPKSVVEAGARRSLAAYGAGILLSIVIGVLAAFLVARSINRPIARLRDAAQAVGRREAPTEPDTDLRELRDVSAALVTASIELAHGEAEREHLLRREQAARAAAESANRAKDEFLAMLGHELRNPLGAISNAAALLQHPALDSNGRGQAVGIITRQVGHLTRLTDDLLDAGRAIMGKIVLQRQPVNLAHVAAQAIATLKAAGRTDRHKLVESYEPTWIEADRIRVDQIISNLVINAVKYTPPGGRIEVSVREELGNAVLTVSDEGIGLEPELAARVFDLFVQGDRDLDRALGGLGIGLTLVKRLAELHGGTASVTSAGTDRGSEFRVTFPAVEAPDPTQPQSMPAPERARRDILIVEDNADARETLKHVLELAGHRVRAASDGVAGLQAALTQRPEVALIDIGLPLMDGYEVARRIRAAEARASLLLVALTGYGLPEDRQRAIDAGFDAHLVKPVDVEALQELLASRGFPAERVD
jgi:signal transduction histidine kinase/ActR/RegA family two-component response regulator